MLSTWRQFTFSWQSIDSLLAIQKDEKSDDLYPISYYDMIPSFKDTGDRPGGSGPDQTGFYFNRDCRSNQVTNRKRSKRCRETT